MTTYREVDGEWYWVCPECNRIAQLSGCTFGHCMKRVERLVDEYNLKHPPMLESTCRLCLLGVCDKYGTEHT